MKEKKKKNNGFIYKGIVSPLMTNGSAMPIEVGPEEEDEKPVKQTKKQPPRTVKKT